MIISTIAALVLGAQGVKAGPTFCPSTLEKVDTPAVTMSYGGALYSTCCGGCDKPFMKDPNGSIAKAVKEKKTIGVFMYDPISGSRIDAKDAKAYTDYKSIRYFFAKTDEKTKFDAKPAQFVGEIKSEAYFCPVTKEKTTAKEAAGYGDYEGTRYFLCCGGCISTFRNNPAKFVAEAKSAVKPLSAVVYGK